MIVTTSDWTVIPLENLVAQSDQIIATVKNVKEAELALHVLEKGRVRHPPEDNRSRPS